MSLKPDDRGSRARSKSPGRRSRSRSRSRAGFGAPSPPTAAPAEETRFSYVTAPSPANPAVVELPAMPGAFGGSSAAPHHQLRRPSQAMPGLSNYASLGASRDPMDQALFSQTRGGGEASGSDSSDEDAVDDHPGLPPHQRPGHVPPPAQYDFAQPGRPPVSFVPSPIVQHAPPLVPQYAQTPSWSHSTAPQTRTVAPQPARTPSGGQVPRAQVGAFQYAAPPTKITYTARPVVAASAQLAMPYAYSAHPQIPSAAESPPQAQLQQQQQQPPQQPQQTYLKGPYTIKEVVPGGGKLKAPPSPGLRPHRLSASGQRPDLRAPSPSGLTPRMDRLSVSGDRPDLQSLLPGQLPPASPLLEAYHGTYQSISPMPSPVVFPRDDDIDDLPPLSPRISDGSAQHRRSRSSVSASAALPPPPPSPPSKKRLRFYDADADARLLADALSKSPPDAGPLIAILPSLSHAQMLELRSAYKALVKMQGHGINIAKHVKLKTSGAFGKAAYATALGRWESEAHWANVWYQRGAAARELLLEALMGRPNAEVAEIRRAFRDRRYGDDLGRCVEKELRADKFKRAVMMVLEERRQAEEEVWPAEYRERDADVLREALRRRDGGETAILEIVVLRSETHLREVLRTYERKYRGNFARECLKRSGNLVGEVVAHVLNGVINKPARDAMLLNHALEDLATAPSSASTSNPTSSNPATTSSSAAAAKHHRQERHELLLSRLVRLHWDREHLRRVAREYGHRYGRGLEDDVAACVGGAELRRFCLALCGGDARG